MEVINLKVLRRNSGILKRSISKRKRDGLTFIGLSDGTLISLVELKMSLLTSGELGYMVCEGPLQLKLFNYPNAGSGVGFWPQKRASTKPPALLSSIPQLLAWADGEQAPEL